MILPVVAYGDPVLREECKEIEEGQIFLNYWKICGCDHV